MKRFIIFMLPVLVCLSCAKDHVKTINGNQVVGVSLKTNNIPADNYTYAEIDITVDSGIMAGQTDIVFTATAGTFQNGNATYNTTLDLSGHAKVYLKNNSIQSVTVVATLHALYSNQVSVDFVTSYPDYLTVDAPDSVVNTFGNFFQIKTHLNKNSGVITPGLPVAYSAKTDNGTSIGSFDNVRPPDATGLSSVDFHLQDTTFRGVVHFTSTLAKPGGQPLTATNQTRMYK
jgi:hypothetical protein